MTVEVKCDMCKSSIYPPMSALKKHRYIKIRIYAGHSRSLRLDLCRDCSKKLLAFLKIKTYEELDEMTDKRIIEELIK